jgi:sortase A
MSSRPHNLFRRWLERALLVVGLTGAFLWIASMGVPAVWQRWEKWSFERIMRDGGAAAGFPDSQPGARLKRAPRPRQPRELVGRLAIPRLGVDTIVREGSDAMTLSLAAGHIPGTAFPGQMGNVAVAGHRDSVFRRLSGIHVKDRIRLETVDGAFIYEVESISVVTPRETGVLRAGPYPELTLVTCYPFNFIGPAPKRFIVKARLALDGKSLHDQFSGL